MHRVTVKWLTCKLLYVSVIQEASIYELVLVARRISTEDLWVGFFFVSLVLVSSSSGLKSLRNFFTSYYRVSVFVVNVARMFALWGNVIYSTRMLHFLVVFRGMRWPRDAILWKQCLRTIAEHMTACGLLCCFYDPCFKSHVARDDILSKVINQVIIEGRRKRRKQRKFWMMTLQNGQDVIFSHLRTLPRSESGGRLWFLRLSSTPLRCTTRVTRRHDAMF